MAEQVIEHGAVLVTESGIELQCTGIRFEENADGERFNHEYIFRSKAELDAEREAAEARQREIEEEQARLQDEAQPAEPTNPSEGDQQ